MNRREALERVLFLKGLPPEVLWDIAAAGYEKRLLRSEVLFRETERCQGLLVVLQGTVKACKHDTRGREMVLGIAHPGTSIGDLALFDGGNYPYSAEACTDETTVLCVSGDRFQRLMDSHPEIGRGVVRALAIEQRKLLEMLKAQALHTVRARVAAYLLAVAGDEITFPLLETNAAIGGRIGTVREVVSRTLHGLEDIGAIHLRGRTVTLLDTCKLRLVAERDA